MSIHEMAKSGYLLGLQRLLIQSPSLLNQRNITTSETPLHVAARHNRVEIVKYLLEWKGLWPVELEAKDIYGETALHMAAKIGFYDIVKMLLAYGANVEAKTNSKLMTPLHLAVRHAMQSRNNSMVKLLLDYKADSYAKDSEGKIPSNYIPSPGHEYKELKLLLLGQQVEDVAQRLQNFAAGQTRVCSCIACQNAALHQNQNFAAGQTYNTSRVCSCIACQNAASHQNHSFTAGQIYNTPPAGNSSYTVVMNSLSTGYQNVLQQPAGNYDDSVMKRKLDEFDLELSTIVGLHNLKQQLRQWAKGMLLDEKRRSMGMNLGPRKLPHMAFLGNPGTGKTTIGRMIGKLLHSIGVLSSDTMIEVQRTDLVGEYIGQTGPKTKKKIQEAMGGILFVDEAYQLAPKQSARTSVDYGKEALEEIMSVLEDGNLLVVFAGYTEPMKSVFSSNEGFYRRVTHHFQFDDYSCRDLAEMLMIKMTKQNEKSRLYGFKLHPYCTYEAVLAVIERNSTEKLRNKLNGGLVDHMMNNARESLDSRLYFNSNGDELLTITIGDLEAGLKVLSQRLNVG